MVTITVIKVTDFDFEWFAYFWGESNWWFIEELDLTIYVESETYEEAYNLVESLTDTIVALAFEWGINMQHYTIVLAATFEAKDLSVYYEVNTRNLKEGLDFYYRVLAELGLEE